MTNGNENLKTSSTGFNVALKDDSFVVPFNKLNKLITALYIVTDIMDKDEPLRTKLRNLGAEIISDTYTNHKDIPNKINEILSFLDIASAVQMISEMNSSILKKEFVDLKNAVSDLTTKEKSWLEEFVSVPSQNNNDSLEENHFNRFPKIEKTKTFETIPAIIPNINSFKNTKTANIGLQKGSTLMKALSEKIPAMSVKRNGVLKDSHAIVSGDFDELKSKRREEIVSIIKQKNQTHPEDGGATIKDIKTSAFGVLKSCGEKTLQRELIAMVKDGVLNKVGEKRWSKYFLSA